MPERYAANRVTATQQLPFGDGTKTLDLCLFVNGLPVATAELKTHLTGQSVEDAKDQYRRDRDPASALLRRAVVHFAVDTETVAMTTRLAGKATQFLPFNLGHEMGPGNPPGEDGKHRSRAHPFTHSHILNERSSKNQLSVSPRLCGSSCLPNKTKPRRRHWPPR